MGNNTDGRGRGVLTETDREYLRGEKEYKHDSTEDNRKQEIRTRLENAILDIPLILDSLPDEELRSVVEDSRIDAQDPTTIPGGSPIRQTHANSGETVGIIDREIERGLLDMVLLIYRVMLLEGRPEGAFSRMLENSHAEAVTQFKPNLEIQNVDHEIETWDRDSLASAAERKYKRGERLTGWEVQALLATERVPDEDVGEYVRGSMN